jgi:hypothetical protein
MVAQDGMVAGAGSGRKKCVGKTGGCRRREKIPRLRASE